MIKKPDCSSLYKTAEGYRKVMAHYQATLQGIEFPHESHYVETSYGLTHILTSGNENGQPVVLWHGQNGSLLSWLHWLPALNPIYRTYAIDSIGGMGKSAPTRPSKKGLDYGIWAAEVLKKLELRHSNMIGISQGTWVINKLASVASEMINSATLMSASGFLPLDMMMILRTLPRVLFKPPEKASQVMVDIVSPPNVRLDPFFLELLELTMRYFRSEPAAPVLSDEEIKKLTAPTYLLMGQYEVAVKPYQVIKRGVELLPNLISAEIVPGVGHSMIHSQADWVTSRVLNFLDIYA
jgi:pimeloyl-ACP methyl ester carboxylesterase